MQAECIAEGLCLCLTQFGELRCCIHHWAVMLAELHRLAAIAGVLDRSCVSGISEVLGKPFKRSDRLMTTRLDVLHQLLRANSGKTGDSGASLLLRNEPQGLDCQVVVFLAESSVTSGGQAEHLAWPTATSCRSGPIWRTISAADQSIGTERRKGLAHSGGCQRQALCQLRGRARALLKQAARHALCGLTGEFHNPIVA